MPAPTKRLLLHFKIPARVDNPDKVVNLLGGPEHLSQVKKLSLIEIDSFNAGRLGDPVFREITRQKLEGQGAALPRVQEQCQTSADT